MRCLLKRLRIPGLLLFGLAHVGLCFAGPSPEGFPKTSLEDLQLRQWTLEDGIPTETLASVVRTTDGFLWISTYEGLLRFDGLRFEVFDKYAIAERSDAEEVLIADSFFDLLATPLDASFQAAEEPVPGELWIGGQGGQILRFRNGRFEIFQTSIEGPVYSLCYDGVGQLWAGGLSSAVLDLRSEPPKKTPLPGLQGVPVEAVACNAETVWFGSSTGGLYILENNLARDEVGGARQAEGKEVKRIDVGAAIDSLALGSDGNLWIGRRDGLSRWNGEELETFEEMRKVGIYRLEEDLQGDLWMATTHGLARRRAGGAVDRREALPEGLVEAHDLEFDREGNLWVAGRRGGLFRLKEGKLQGISSRNGLRAGSIDSLHEMRDGRILVGFDDYLATIDLREENPRRRIVEKALPPGFDSYDMIAVYEDRDGVIWLGSYTGLLRLLPEGGHRFDSRDTGFPSSQIRTFHQDATGRMWVGTGNRGVLSLNPAESGGEAVEILDQNSGLISNFVFSIREGKAGELYFALRGGVQIRMPTGELRTFRSGTDLPGSLVFNVFPESKDTFWLATDSGLVRYRGGNFSVIGEPQGLPKDTLFDLHGDAYDGLWMSSTLGVIRGSITALHEFMDQPNESLRSPLEFEVFGEENGMPNRQCVGARQTLATRDGELWFPTHGGIAVANPREIPRDESPPMIRIDRFSVDGQEISADGPATLESGLSRYSFEFSVLSLRDPEANQMRYRLEGFDETWQESSTRRSVSYTSLPAGEYVFHVIGANGDGIWNEVGDRRAFQVLPFYYETFLFRISVLFATAFLFFGIYQWRELRLRKRRMELEELAEQRRRLILALQARGEEIDRYLYIFSHDFKNPLLTIQNYAGAIRSDLESGDVLRAEKDLERISFAADQLNQQLNDLLRIAEAERAQTSQVATSFVRLAKAAILRHQESFIDLDVELIESYEDAEDLKIFGDRRRIMEVFEELLGNALKFQRSFDVESDGLRPQIEIGALRNGDEALCWVRDNGIGIAPTDHQKIFQPLVQLDRRTEGTGIGLALVTRVVERHGGRVWIESVGEGKGTTVWLLLPILDARRGVVDDMPSS